MRFVVLTVSILVAGCGTQAEPQPTTKEEHEQIATKVVAAVAPNAEQAALDQAKTAAKSLGGQLKSELMSALASGTPKDALKMCAGQAQPMTAGVTEQTGVRVGRSSLRLRNQTNAPPEWVKTWLDRRGERKIDGVDGIARVDETADGKVARFLVPIGIEPPCLSCHGPADALADGVKEGLAEHYPDDAAVGYAVGDLRGALWAEAKVTG